MRALNRGLSVHDSVLPLELWREPLPKKITDFIFPLSYYYVLASAMELSAIAMTTASHVSNPRPHQYAGAHPHQLCIHQRSLVDR